MELYNDNTLKISTYIIYIFLYRVGKKIEIDLLFLACLFSDGYLKKRPSKIPCKAICQHPCTFGCKNSKNRLLCLSQYRYRMIKGQL